MKQGKTRSIVGGIDFQEVFRFPKILTAIPAAMQPPRLLIGLVMVAVLMIAGKSWDAWFESIALSQAEDETTEASGFEDWISPDGLLDPEWASEESIALNAAIGNLVPRLADRFTRDTDGMVKYRNNPGLLLEDYASTYRYRRDSDRRSGVGTHQLALNDQEYFDNVAAIDAVRPRRVFEATIEFLQQRLTMVMQGVINLRPLQVLDGLSDLFVRLPAGLWSVRPWFAVCFGAVIVLVMTFGGGALSRMSACEFSGNERLRSADALAFSRSAAGRLLGGIVLPLIVVGIFAVILIATGFALLQVPYLDILGGLLYGLALLVGFVMAFLLIGYAAGLPMIVPAVATENCAPADALQRAIAYVISRPLHLVGYVLVAIIGLTLGYFIVALVASTTLNLTAGATGTFATTSPSAVTGDVSLFDLSSHPAGGIQRYWHNAVAAWLINLWERLIVLLVYAYVLSYVFSSATIIYMLMRKLVDRQDFAEIWHEGLVPGTLAPLPRATSGRPRAQARRRASDNVLHAAMRKAASIRFGRKQRSPATRDDSTTPDKPSDDADDSDSNKSGS